MATTKSADQRQTEAPQHEDNLTTKDGAASQHPGGHRRYTLRLSPALAEHVEDLAGRFDCSLSDVFKDAISLYSWVLNELASGKALALVGKDGKGGPERICIPGMTSLNLTRK